jgi:serine protease AprX
LALKRLVPSLYDVCGLALLDDAAAAGITVFCSDNLGRDGLAWGGCPVESDRNLPENYQVANPDMLPADRPTLIVPGDRRTTASNTGPNDYVYYGLGGWSWGIP